MISQFSGAIGQLAHSINREDQSGIRDEYFSFLSSEKVYTCSDYYISIHGTITGVRDTNYRSLIKTPDKLIKILHKGDIQNPQKLLDGLFFIIIYNKKARTLSLWNNRYNCTNCYTFEAKANGASTLFFSNNIINLVKVMKRIDHKVEPDFGAIRSFISNGFTMTESNQIKGIKKILPCFLISKNIDTPAVWRHHADTEFTFERKPFTNLEKKLDEYESLYQKSISSYLDYNKSQQLGTLLSGGHDTSFTLIQASKVYPKPVHAFTVTFPNWPWDEGSYAQNICQKYGGDFHPIPFYPKDLDLIVSMVRGNQEPVVGSSLPLHKLGKEAKQHVDILLGGDGGDTLWGEYYPVGELHKWVCHLPVVLREAVYQLSKAMVSLTDWERFWELKHVAKLFTTDNYYSHFMRNLCTYRHFSLEYQAKLLTPEVFNQNIPAPIYEVPFTKENFSEALIEGKLYNAFYTYQSFSTHRSIEHFGTKFYLPNINKDLMDFITTLPESWVNGGTTFHRLTNNKTINRRFHKMALSRYLKKEEIYNRSFDIPWYKILKPRTHALELLKTRLKKRGWYQEPFIDKLFEEFKAQEAKDYELLELKHHGYRIFTLLSLEVWATEFLDMRLTESFDDGVNLEDYLANS